jgi:DNA-binding NarL/FixJ family response regulator
VLTLIATGRSNAEIAGELFDSGFTVENDTDWIFVKLDLRDRAATIIYAYDNRSSRRNRPQTAV